METKIFPPSDYPIGFEERDPEVHAHYHLVSMKAHFAVVGGSFSELESTETI